jgi:hypothetical protein
MLPMVGVLAALLLSLLAANAARTLLGSRVSDLDPAERFGVCGLLGLGGAGLLIFLVGLLPGGLAFAPYVAGVVLLALQRIPEKITFKRPEGWALGALGLFILTALQGLIGVLSPSTSLDWDSLAYHLDVPKKWMAEGQITYIPALHQSNFPGGANVLYIPGLMLGGESGAKAFMLAFFLFGGAAIFGLLRRWGGEEGGSIASWTGLVGFAGIPVVAWQAGAAYVDMAHGIFAALGVAYAVEAFSGEESESRARTILAALALGFCLSTKLTGLQVMAGLGIILLAGGLVSGRGVQGFKTAAIVCGAALVIASPWYIRTAINTGNPVYPFFYSILGGKEWDKFRADIYAEEQGTFGVAKTPLNLGHAVLGLGYQPGRYVNPAQQSGGGFPTGALGFGVVLAGLAAAASGRLNRREKLILGYVGVGLLFWFILSQQSRYLPILAIPLVVAAASTASRMKMPVVPAAFGLQGIGTLVILYLFITSTQLPVALGRADREQWRETQVPFARAAKEINALPDGSKIALYDEVFGFLVKHRTMWGNPGHSTLIPHEASQTGKEWAEGLRKLGFTHVYVNTQYQSREGRARWAEAAGLVPGEPYSESEKAELWSDLRQKWRWLVADASRNGSMEVLTSVGSGVIFALKDE